MNVNKVTIAGRLTRDPELRFTANGKTPVAQLGIATSRTWYQEKEKKEETTFVDVTAFGKQAETIAQYFRKGSRIYVEGRLKLDTWDDKNTKEKRSKLNVVMETFQFVDTNAQSGGEAPSRTAPRNTSPAAPKPSSPDPGAPPAEDDDVPFISLPKHRELRMLGIPTINKLA